jgi:hypothetical protein
MTEARYMVRRQSNGLYCVWDHNRERPAEDNGAACEALSFDAALELAKSLNDMETAATIEILIQKDRA